MAYQSDNSHGASPPRFLHLHRLLLTLLAAAVAVDLGAILFFSRYFNYGAEGIEIGALLRLSDGLPYMTKLSELPLFANQYSPYFYALAEAPIKLLGLHSLEAIALCSRLLELSSLLALGFAVYFELKHLVFSKTSFLLLSAWFILLFPANIICVRPDFPAFLLEFLGFACWRRAQARPSVSFSSGVGYAGVLFGCAIALKLNTIGVVGGLLLFEVVSRRWARAFVLGGVTAVTVAVLFAGSWAIWGPQILRDTFLAIQNQMEAPHDLLSKLVVFGFLAPPLTILAILGLRALRKRGSPDFSALAFAMAVSFAIATLQQIKAGSWYNYYYGYFALALAPAALGLDALVTAVGRMRCLHVALLVTAVVHAGLAARVPGVIARDRIQRHFPYREVTAWAEKELPAGPIYCDESNAALYFNRRTLFGPVSEIILALTPAIQPTLPRLKLAMSQRPPVAAVVTGRSCASWRPAGAFREELSHLTKLKHEAGWLCVFVPEA
jgi:hypothetical protein